MNVIFTFIFISALIVFAVFSPDKALAAMTSGGQKAVTLSMSLLVIYSVWSGILQVAEDSGAVNKLSKLLRPIINKLFKNPPEDEAEDISVNISANLLGLGGVATPADAALMMQLGAEGVFVGSGIFKGGDPAKRAAAIVKAVANFTDAKLIAELSEDLGEAMVGINADEIEIIMEERGR